MAAIRWGVPQLRLAVLAGKSAGLATILARPCVVVEVVLIDPHDLALAMGFCLGLAAILAALRLRLGVGGLICLVCRLLFLFRFFSLGFRRRVCGSSLLG